jgi:hypothetical protein
MFVVAAAVIVAVIWIGNENMRQRRSHDRSRESMRQCFRLIDCVRTGATLDQCSALFPKCASPREGS